MRTASKCSYHLKFSFLFSTFPDEYLNYAQKNRNEWETRGEQIVQEYIENAKDLTAPEDDDEHSSEESDESGSEESGEEGFVNEPVAAG